MTKLASAFKFLLVVSLPFSSLSFSPVAYQNKKGNSETIRFAHTDDISVSRRTAFMKSAAAVAGGMSLITNSPLPSLAVVSEETPKVTTRMGGLLEKYQDSRGWTILAPSGWNKFEGEVGAYDVKWQDVVDNKENIKVSSNPVKSTTTSM